MQRDQWRFTLGGTEQVYGGYVSAPDAILIKKHSGLTVLSFLTGVFTGDPEALVALVLLTKRQAGEKITWDEAAELLTGEDDLMALINSLQMVDKPEAPDAAAEAAEEKPARKKAAPKEPQPTA